MSKIIRLSALLAMILFGQTVIFSQELPDENYNIKIYSKDSFAIWEYIDYGYGTGSYQHHYPKNYRWIGGQAVRVTEKNESVEIENIIIDLGNIPNRIVGKITKLDSGLRDYVFSFPQEVEEYKIRDRDPNEKAYYRLVKYEYNPETDKYTNMCDETTEMHLTEDQEGVFHMNCIDINSGKSVEAWICVADETDFIVDNEEREILLHPYTANITSLPENLEVMKWDMLRLDHNTVSKVYVAWDDEYLYLKGLFDDRNTYNDHDYFIEGHEGSHWIKGIRDGDSVIFDNGQYIGMDKFKYLCSLYYGGCTPLDSGAEWYNTIFKSVDTQILMEFKDNTITHTTPDRSTSLNSGVEAYTGGSLKSFIISPDISGIDRIGINSTDILGSKKFDLMGREIANPQKGTVYIQNGKKHIAR